MVTPITNYGVCDPNRLFGRAEICLPIEEVTAENVAETLSQALQIHLLNAAQIDYLYRYMKGEQPVLQRVKTIRPEICNKVVENHAAEIAQFTSGYFMGEPVTYVRRGERNEASNAINALNNYMAYEDKASHDKEMATWMAICGVGYRMVRPDKNYMGDPDESPFEIDTPDPRDTFVVYSTGFGHKCLMGVQIVVIQDGNIEKTMYCGYTATNYFEVVDGKCTEWQTHSMNDVPIFEYRLNMLRMGSFEPAIPIMNAINTLASNRMDGVEQYVQSFLKFINCDVTNEQVKQFGQLGAIVVKSESNHPADVQLVSQELNQTQTQTFVDHLYEQMLVICGMPTSYRGGASSSDNLTGNAVLLRDGWQQTEARARDTELLFKRSEKHFLRVVLRILRVMIQEPFDLRLSEIECKFTRRQHDNLLTKTQSLMQMLESGLSPEVAISTCGLFNDPMDVATKSKLWLEKWKPVDDTVDMDDTLLDDSTPEESDVE